MIEEIKSLAQNIETLVKKQDEATELLKKHDEEITGIKKKNGKLPGTPMEQRDGQSVVNEMLVENFDRIGKITKGETLSFERKAGNITISNVSSSGSATNSNYTYANFGVATRPRRKVVIRDLVPVISSNTGTFVYFRQATPIGAGSFAFQAGQGTTKAALDKNLIQVIVNCDYLAGTARIAKQMLQDLPAMQSFLSADLLEDYRRAESAAFIPTLVASASAYSPGASVTVEMIIQSIADLLSKDFEPSAIVTTADVWAKVMNTKPQNYSLPGGGSAVHVDANGVITFLGIPLLVQNNMIPGQILIGDFTKAAIIQAEGLSMAFFDQDQDNVVRNLITARLEARVGFTVLRSDAFDIFTAGTT
ncbi:MAG: phage major capsid protein [Mucilaginibacter sp.]